VADHVLGDVDLFVDLAVVDQEAQADKVGQDGGGARLSLDDGDFFAGLGALDRKALRVVSFGALALGGIFFFFFAKAGLLTALGSALGERQRDRYVRETAEKGRPTLPDGALQQVECGPHRVISARGRVEFLSKFRR
jgi:hypothetical protein